MDAVMFFRSRKLIENIEPYVFLRQNSVQRGPIRGNNILGAAYNIVLRFPRRKVEEHIIVTFKQINLVIYMRGKGGSNVSFKYGVAKALEPSVMGRIAMRLGLE